MTDPRTNAERHVVDRTSQTNVAGLRPCAFASCERWIDGPELYCCPEHEQRGPRVVLDWGSMAMVNLDDALQDTEKRLEQARETFVDLMEQVAEIRTRIAAYDLWGRDESPS